MARVKLTHRRVEFTVCGSGRFPLDMLRYDQCAPRTSGDSAAILGHENTEFRVVSLNGYSVNGDIPITAARWESFGWFALTPDELYAYHSNPSINAVLDLHAVIQGRLTAAGNFPRREGT